MSSDEINVYWAPVTTHENNDLGEWNMLYPDPKTLFSELQSQRLPGAGENTFFSCPATNDKFRKTYVFKNDLDSDYEFDFTSDNSEEKYFNATSETYIGFSIRRPPTIAKGPMVNFNLFYSFFADQPLEAIFTPPMLHEPQYTKYGTCVPGQFDIGQWYRPYPMEIQMWNMKGEFHLKAGEPMFYVEFKTDKKINLHRYKMNATAAAYLKSCSTSKRVWGPGLSLLDRYSKFNSSRMPELVLKEIKENLL